MLKFLISMIEKFFNYSILFFTGLISIMFFAYFLGFDLSSLNFFILDFK